MTDIYIVRHGNTFDKGDVVTRVGARTDLPLSDSGREQAIALATHFVERVPEGFDLAYCSPLLRTLRTAQTILNPAASPPPIETLEFLREVDYGPDENQPEEKVIARIGEAAILAWETKAVPPPGWQVDPERIKSAWIDLIHELVEQKPERPVLVVTSNGIARFVLEAITHFAAEPTSIKLKTGAYGLIRAEADRVTLINWNLRP